MNHVNYFSDLGLKIDLTSDDNLKIKGLSILQGDLRNQVLQYAKENKWRIVFEIQTENKSLEEKIETLWNKATQLENWVDDPHSEVDWEIRTARVQELQEMSLEIDRLKAQQTTPNKTIMDMYSKIEPYWKNKWMSPALEDINKILNANKVKFKKKKYKEFVYDIGAILKPDIKKNKQLAIKIIEDLAYLKSVENWGHPVSIEDCVNG